MEQGSEAETPRPSVENEVLVSRELPKVGRIASTEELKKADPERRSHGFHRSVVESIGMPN
jgi:hypothetical protein